MNSLWHVWCMILAAAPFVLPREDIHIECRENSVLIKWKVGKDLAQKPARLHLGKCLPSHFSLTADGGGEAVFHYGFTDCGFRPRRTEKKLHYENKLTFSPLPKPNPPQLVFPFNCTTERPEWMRPFVKPSVSVALHGHAGLVFHMALLNDELSGPAPSNSYPLGSFINIWASVEEQLHQPLMLHLEECLVASSPTLGPDSLMYPVIAKYGCLVDGKRGLSRFLPRYQPSSLILQLQASMFAVEQEVQEVFIYCRLVVWDPEDLNEEKKSCNYNTYLGGWELLDDPQQNSLCQCCDSSCHKKVKRGLHSESYSPAQSFVFGPLIITSHSSGSDTGSSR